MNIANQIKNNFSSFAQALEQADKVAVDAEQDWENSTTVFIFSDGSRLQANYPDMKVLQ